MSQSINNQGLLKRKLQLLQRRVVALQLKNKALEHLAARDVLTGLYNRRMLDERFAAEVSRSERYGRPLSIILLDVDHFKAVNDTHGHPVGDAVLIETAERLQSALRASDTLGRWGGEEFLIICPRRSSKTTIERGEGGKKFSSSSSFTSPSSSIQ